MASNSNNSKSLINILNISEESVINLQVCIKSISENLYNYFLFNLHLIFNYINNQLIYYYTTEVIFEDNQFYFH